MTTIPPPPGFGFLPQEPLTRRPQVEKPNRSKRVSWAPDESLCEVRWFLANDAPVMSRIVQVQQLTEPPRNLHICNPTSCVPTPHASDGLIGSVPVTSQPAKMALATSTALQTSWRKPCRVDLDPTWNVRAGEASLETRVQQQRELRILEAFYPRPSSIPENPAEPVEAEEPYDDSTTQEIPLNPIIEEEEFPVDCTHVSSLLSGQVAGGQLISGGVTNGRQEKVKQALEGTDASSWGNDTVGPKIIPIYGSSAVISGKPAPAALIPDVPTDSMENGAKSDGSAAAALTEIGSMIDIELLTRILNDPSILQSLSSDFPFVIANSNPEMSSTSMNSHGAFTLPHKISQRQVTIGAICSAANGWISSPASSYMSTVPAGRQGEDWSRTTEFSVNADARFQRTQGFEESPSTVQPGALGSAQLDNSLLGIHPVYTGPTSGGEIVHGQLSEWYNSGDLPAFGTSKLNVNGNRPAGLASKPTFGAQQEATPQVWAQASWPLSSVGEEYFNKLVMQHRTAKINVSDKGSARARFGNDAPEATSWNGMEQLNTDRVESYAQALPKTQKICIYFGTPQGCRNGDSCAFVHELGAFVHRLGAAKKRKQTIHASLISATTQFQHAKRLKVDGLVEEF